MNYKTTLILFLLVAILGGFFLFGPTKPAPTSTINSPTQPGATSQGKPLLDQNKWRLPNITGVGFKSDRQDITVNREGEEWYQTKPVRWRMNEMDIPNLINVATSVRSFDSLTPDDAAGTSLKTLSLDPAEVEITLYPKTAGTAADAKSAEPLVLQVGRLGVAGVGYLKVKGQPQVHVVDDSLHQLVLGRKATDWRTQSLVGVPGPGQASQVKIQTPNSLIVLTKNDGVWSFDQTHAGRVDQDSVNQFITALGQVFAVDFVEDGKIDLARYGLNKPTLVINIATPAPKAASKSDDNSDDKTNDQSVYSTLTVGAPTDLSGGLYYATWSTPGNPPTTLFTIRNMQLEKLSKAADSYRDHRLVTLPFSDVTTIQIQPSGSSSDGYTMRLIKEAWQFASADNQTGAATSTTLTGNLNINRDLTANQPPALSPDTPTVNTILHRLIEARAKSFEPLDNADTKPGYIAPAGVITLSGLAGLETQILTFFNHSDEAWKVRFNQEPAYLLVDKKALPNIFLKKDQILDMNLINLIPQQVTGIVIERKESAYPGTFKLTKTTNEKTGESTWELGEPGGNVTAEQAAASRIIELIAPLRAANRLGEPATKTATNNAATIRFTVTGAEGQTFTFGIAPSSTPGKAVLFTGDKPTGQNLPTAPAGLLEALEAELVNRTMLAVGVDQIGSITIGPGAEPDIVTQGARGSYRNPKGKIVDPSKAGPMFDTLAGLRAERVLTAAAAKDLGAPTRTIQVSVKEGPTYTLNIYRKEGKPTLGTLTGPEEKSPLKVFTLSDGDVVKLMAEPIAEIKPAR